MIHRIVTYISGVLVFFQTSDSVLQAGCARYRPIPREGIQVPDIGGIILGLGSEFFFQLRKCLKIREHPGFSTVGQCPVAEKNHRSHVFECNPERFQSNIKAVAGSRGGKHRNWGFAMSSMNCGQKVGLLGFSR